MVVVNYTDLIGEIAKNLNENKGVEFYKNLNLLVSEYRQNLSLSQLKEMYPVNLTKEQKTLKINYFIRKFDFKTFKLDSFKTNERLLKKPVLIPKTYKLEYRLKANVPKYMWKNDFFKDCGEVEIIKVDIPSKVINVAIPIKERIKKVNRYIMV